MKSIWIARDKDGSLFMYRKKPERRDDLFHPIDGSFLEIDEENEIKFNDVTWENSPVECRIIINKKEE